jgi:hypothetical protein
MKTFFGLFAIVFATSWCGSAADLAVGRELPSAGDLYSRGIHAFYAGRSGEAEMRLSQALELSPYDPRLYYFRGLSKLRLGRSGEARHDFAVGAALEAERPNRYGVGRALERVQGDDRLLLERYRRDAREQAVTIAAEDSGQRRAQLSAHDRAVRRARVVIPLDALLQPGEPRMLSAEEVARLRAVDAQPGVKPAQRVPEVIETNPFEDDTAEAAVVAPLEPAAGPAAPTAPAAPTPPSPPPAEHDDEDLFGDF